MDAFNKHILKNQIVIKSLGCRLPALSFLEVPSPTANYLSGEKDGISNQLPW